MLVQTPDATLEVRPLRPDELPRVVQYFTDASDEDNERMGVDKARLPSPAEWVRRLEAAMRAPPQEAASFYFGWRVNRETVGFASLKNIRFGDRGDIHLHMWSAPHRGRGFGGALFSMSALQFYERFRLKRIVCEPSAKNPMPNRMLAKAGFPLVKTYVGASSEISQRTTLNQYDIVRSIADRFLRRFEGGE